MAGRRESSLIGPPPQRLGREPLQQTQPAPPWLRFTRRPLRRLPMQQQLKHGYRIFFDAAVTIQLPPVRLPPYTPQRRLPRPGSRLPFLLRRSQDGREGIYQISIVFTGQHEDGGLKFAEEHAGLNERADLLYAPSHSDLRLLLYSSGQRLRRQSVPPWQPAGVPVRFHPQEQKQGAVLHRGT